MRVEHLAPSVTLHLGDCREIAPTLPRPAAVISDPPYGMNRCRGFNAFTGGKSGAISNRGRVTRGRAGGETWAPMRGDDVPFDPSPWIDLAPAVVLFGANHFAARLPIGTTLVWIKKRAHLWGTFLSDAEVAWMRGGVWGLLHRGAVVVPERNH